MTSFWAADENPSEPGVWVAEFVSKAFIAKIGSEHGFSRYWIPGRLFALLTDATFSEIPSVVDVGSKNFGRLFTPGLIQCRLDSALRLTEPPRLTVSPKAGAEILGFKGEIGLLARDFSLPLRMAHSLETGPSHSQ